MSIAPRWAQRLTGFAHPGIVQRLYVEPYLHAYVRSLRWAFGEPPHVALARRRAAGEPMARARPLASTAIL